MAAPKGAKRELIKVAVQFVSLVKKPANLTAFSLVKSAVGIRPEEIQVYKSADYAEPTAGPVERLIKALLSMLPSKEATQAKTEDEDGADPAALIAKALNLANALEEDDPMSEKQLAKLEAEVAELKAKMEGVAPETVDAAEGITDETKASEIAERFSGLVSKLETDLATAEEKAKASGDKAKAGKPRHRMEKILGAIRTSLKAGIEAIPKDFRGVPKGQKKKGAEAEPTAAEAAAAAKREQVEHRDANLTGVFDKNGITPEAQALIRQQFGDLMKEHEEAKAKEAEADQTIKTLTDEIEKLKQTVKARKSRPSRSQMATGADGGGTAPSSEEEDETSEVKTGGWRPNMADGLVSDENPTELVKTAKSEDDGDFDSCFTAGD